MVRRISGRLPFVLSSGPVDDTTWFVHYHNNHTTATVEVDVQMYVVCI